MPLSKPTVIATEGPTIDGRNISRDWIKQMAANYDPKVYTAVANLEHYLSSMPDSVFGAYGKVVSLSTQESEILGEKKLQLLAVVDANEKLVALQKSGQKAFCSMEVIANFVGKGIAYLSGLAFTDQPASIGTESMKFSLAGAQGERFAFSNEVALEWETSAEKPGAGDALFAKVKSVLGLEKKDSDKRFADQGNAIELLANSQKELLENFGTLDQRIADLTASFNMTSVTVIASADEVAALKELLSKTDGDKTIRKPATGSEGRIKADC